MKKWQKLNSQNLEGEIWKDIKDYEGRYMASNLGRIKSLLYNKEYIITPTIHTVGYYFIHLYKNLKPKSKFIHRLIADTFHDKGDFNYVHHKDENKLNNHESNLMWTTNRGNAIFHYELKGNKTPGVQLLPNGKFQVRLRVNAVKIYFGRFDNKDDADKHREDVLSILHLVGSSKDKVHILKVVHENLNLYNSCCNFNNHKKFG